MVTLNGNGADYRGLSTDQKPASPAMNAIFLEVDTGEFYAWNGTAWVKVGE